MAISVHPPPAMTLPYPSTTNQELPDALSRRPLHTRTIAMNGYRRDDGLFDIEGELQDDKHQHWPSWERGVQPPQQPVHHMRLRLTLDEFYSVRAVAAALPAIPFNECRGTLPPLDSLVGATVSRGWRKAVEAALGGTAGCTHVRELLMAMGTVAYQTLAGEQRRTAFEALPSPLAQLPAPTAPLPHWGRCVSWAFEGDVVRRVAPGVVGGTVKP
jgi:hypothetical protein